VSILGAFFFLLLSTTVLRIETFHAFEDARKKKFGVNGDRSKASVVPQRIPGCLNFPPIFNFIAIQCDENEWEKRGLISKRF
jgi:hypothetical protein